MTGPYIVTTKRQDPEGGVAAPDGSGWTPWPTLSRRAVATLDEGPKGELRVRNAPSGYAVDYRPEFAEPWVTVAGPFNEARVANEAKYAIRSLRDSGGGTITLPDRTVIEVEAVHWSTLIAAVRAATGEQIIDAYNARQEER